MKPYYKDELSTIYHGDAREFRDVIYGIPVITDPPFNIGYHYASHKDKMKVVEYNEMIRSICPPPSVIIHYPEKICEISILLGLAPTRIVAWVYPSNTGRQWRSIGWFGCKPNFRLAGQPYKNPNDKRVKKLIESGRQCKLYDWWQINQVKNVTNEKTAHPCQMPVEVMSRIIKISGFENVADPFLGSGSTMVAAKSLKVHSVGIEMDESYCEIAAKRLERIN